MIGEIVIEVRAIFLPHPLQSLLVHVAIFFNGSVIIEMCVSARECSIPILVLRESKSSQLYLYYYFSKKMWQKKKNHFSALIKASQSGWLGWWVVPIQGLSPNNNKKPASNIIGFCPFWVWTLINQHKQSRFLNPSMKNKNLVRAQDTATILSTIFLFCVHHSCFPSGWLFIYQRMWG